MNESGKPLLLVSLGIAYGGAETYYVRLARILQAQHTPIAVVCCPELAAQFRSLGMDVLCAGGNLSGFRRYLSTLRLCFQMVRRYRPRFAHLNGQPEAYLAPFLRLLGVQIFIGRHTPFTDEFLGEGSAMPVALKRAVVLTCLRLARHTICDSKLLVRQLTEYLPKERVSALPTWVDDELLVPYDRPQPSTPLRTVFVGRVTRNKGIFDLIEALRATPGVHLTVVGEGPDQAEAERLAKGLPIAFAGFATDVAATYRSADLLIFPSHEGFEGLPQVPLEAMAMGVPCLASNISAVREIVSAPMAGFRILALYNRTPQDLALQWCYLASDRDALAELGASGREHVATHFTVAAVREGYLRVFAQALRKD